MDQALTARDRPVRLLVSSSVSGADGGPLHVATIERFGWRIIHDHRWQTWPLDGRRWRRLVRAIERRTVPFMQLILSRRIARRSGATITLAFFESEGHALALVRSLIPQRWRTGRLVVMSCWLSDIVETDARRRRIYRWIYRGVDVVTVFAESQRHVLADRLGLRADQLALVALGVDHTVFAAAEPHDDWSDAVLAVGRDAGRDWRTMIAAATVGGWPAHIVTRPHLVEGLVVPPNVVIEGPIDRDEYVARLGRSRVVVVPSQPRRYPTGQTVLIEAMMAGCAVVVTESEALADYVQHEVTCLVVPTGDPNALDVAVRRLRSDPALAARLGAAARADALARFTAERMWSSVASLLAGGSHG